MKIAILLLMGWAWVSVALGAPPTIELTPNTDDTLNLDYGNQLIGKFNALIATDQELRAQFATFENAPKERAGGRYMGYSATPLVLQRSVKVDFRNDGGERHYEQTVVLHYSFEEGMRQGMVANTGVFAVFRLTGVQSFEHKGGDEFELRQHVVSATFQGFRSIIHAEPQDEE